MSYRTIRPRRQPIPADRLRILQALEAMQHGYALGGEFRVRRTAR